MKPARPLLRGAIVGALAWSLQGLPIPADGAATDEPLPVGGIAANPQAAYTFLGNDFLGRALGIGEASGVRIGGFLAPELDWVASGGVDPGTFPVIAFGLHALIDTGKAFDIPGGSFGIEFLAANGSRNNDAAGSVQMYTNMDSPEPRNRQALEQLWWRQRLFDDRLIVQIGKMNPAGTFNTVLNPVAIDDPRMQDRVISNLLFTPVGLNPTLYAWSPAYPNTAYGIVAHAMPTNDLYASFGIFDGNGARGVQTGCEWWPTFNEYRFNIAEVGYSWRVPGPGLPGRLGAGAWLQTGKLATPVPSYEDGARGYYLFANQRLWYRNPPLDNSGLIGYLQYGHTGSLASAVGTYFGTGVTGIGLIPGRPFDVVSFGFARSVLNPTPGAGAFFYPGVRSSSSDLGASESMLQVTYAANFAFGTPANYWTFTAIAGYTYIPNPGQRPDLPAANVLSLRLVALF